MKKNLIIVQVYVDNMVYELKNDKLCEEFAILVKKEFEIIMMGEFIFFLGLQINKSRNGFTSTKINMPKNLWRNLELNVKAFQVPMSANCKINNDEES